MDQTSFKLQQMAFTRKRPVRVCWKLACSPSLILKRASALRNLYKTPFIMRKAQRAGLMQETFMKKLANFSCKSAAPISQPSSGTDLLWQWLPLFNSTPIFYDMLFYCQCSPQGHCSMQRFIPFFFFMHHL